MIPDLRCCRRGVHSLIAVSFLIGFSLAGAAILFAVLADYRDVSLNRAECSLSNVSLYSTGDNRAYFVATLHNLGSGILTSARVVFVDDSGFEHGFSNDSLAVDPGHVWDVMDSFSAALSSGNTYVIKSTAIMDDGSITNCNVIHEINF